MPTEATIESGFAHVTGGTWLLGVSQPAAYRGALRDRRMGGWIVPDRGRLRSVELSGTASCSDAKRPFLARIDCADTLSVVSERILVAPAASRTGSQLVRVVPMSFRHALAVTEFRNPGWAVTATASRVNRFVLEEGEVLSVRLESVVASDWALPQTCDARHPDFAPPRKIALAEFLRSRSRLGGGGSWHLTPHSS